MDSIQHQQLEYCKASELCVDHDAVHQTAELWIAGERLSNSIFLDDWLYWEFREKYDALYYSGADLDSSDALLLAAYPYLEIL